MQLFKKQVYDVDFKYDWDTIWAPIRPATPRNGDKVYQEDHEEEKKEGSGSGPVCLGA